MKFVVSIILAACLSLLYLNSTARHQQANTYIPEIANSYYANLQELQKEVNTLTELSLKVTDPNAIETLTTQLTRTRLQFKKVEFLLDYFHTAYNHWYINGGPIPKFNDETTKVIEANGLQTLDELLFDPEAFVHIDTIKSVAQDLSTRLQLITDSDAGLKISQLQAVEALRSGCVRIFALGVSGFDTPGSGNGLLEARVSLNSMQDVFSAFENYLKPEAQPSFKQIKTLFKKGDRYLKLNQDFEGFDRLSFLKTIINPLYKALYQFQVDNAIPTERSKYHAQNYKAQNLFDEGFLDTNHYSEFTYVPLDNPATIALGKTLFFDPILSRNLELACASCHDPKRGFADGLPKSKANASGTFTARHAPSLIDAAYASRYFWDMREFDLERQVNHVVENNLEFNIDFDLIVERLYHSTEYVKLFDSCYQGITKTSINSRSISNAIAAYVNSLTSFNSEFDQYVRGEITTYPEDAKAGFNLFMGKAACATCHFVPAFNGTVPPFYTETESEVLGVTQGFDSLNPILDKDLGRMQNHLGKEDLPMFKRSFKTVTVRNADITAPYMHNGSFKTLEDVLEFYNRGGGHGMGLKVDNQTLSSDPLGLTGKEKAQIIAFLKTLTDTSGLVPKSVKLPRFEKHPEWDSRTYDIN